MNTIIASVSFLGVFPTGEERNFVIEIGLPYASSAEEWRCPVAIHGLHGKLGDRRGVDALQSLTLALRIVHQLLAYFEAEGGKLLDPQTREAFSIQIYFPQYKEPTS